MAANQLKQSKSQEDIMSISIGGKRYTVSRALLTVEHKCKLTEWFKVGSVKSNITDKAGHTFLDRDGRTFRHVLNYLRCKRDKVPVAFCLPSKPDELARLCAEANYLRMNELKSQCMSMLQKYSREEDYVLPYVETIVSEYNNWNFEKSGNKATAATAEDKDPW